MADVEITVSDEYVSRGGFGKARKETEELGEAIKKQSKNTTDLATNIEKAFKKVSTTINLSGVEIEKNFMGNFNKLMKEAESTGKEGGNAIGTAVVQGTMAPWKSAPGQIKGMLITTLVTAAIAAAPLVGGALAGGIVTAFSAGIVALGIVSAAQSSNVQSQWSKTSKEIGRDMVSISVPFQQSIIDSISAGKREFETLKPTLRSVFADMAPDVGEFGSNLAKSISALGPAIEPMSKAFQAVLGDLGPRLPGIISDIADSLTKLSDSVEQNPEALGDLVALMGNLAEAGLFVTRTLNDTYAAHKTFFDLIVNGPQALEALEEGTTSLTGAVLDGKRATDDYTSGLDFLVGATANVRSGSQQWEDALKTLAAAEDDVVKQGSALLEMMDIMAGRSPNYEEAIQGMNDTIRDLSEHFSESKNHADGWGDALLNADGTVNTLTANGSRLQDAMVELQQGFANASAAARELAEREGISLAEATKRVTNDLAAQRNNLINTAQQMGLNKGQAEQLANAYGLIPRSVVTMVELRTNAYAAIASVQNAVNTIRGMFASGGNVGVGTFSYAAQGGQRGNNVIMNDGNGPEAVRLPQGSTVMTAEDTRGMNERWSQSMRTGGGGSLVYTGMGAMGGLERLFFTFLQEAIRNNRLQIPGVNI